MTKTKRHITILAIGERSDYDSYKKFDYDKRIFINSGFDYVSADYQQFLDGKIEQIKTEKVIIFLFFPFSYWDRYIEHKNYRGIYGNRIFFKKFVHFWSLVEKKVKEDFADKKILFVNNPQVCGMYRDKLTLKRKLANAHIVQPKLWKISCIKDIQKKLIGGHNFFLKPRYGSMGKGITFLNWSNWQTNFIFKNNKIISRRSDHGWRLRDITGNNKFLGQLLKKDILIEEAIEPLILKEAKFDFRIYTFFKKVIYIYPRKNLLDKITTNISQGAQGDPRLLRILPEHLIAKAKKTATKVASVLGLNLMGIDIMPDHNLKDVYVVDVNVFPGFPKRRTFDLTQCIIRNLIRMNNKGKFCFNKSRNI